MRIILLGSTGQIGTELMRVLPLLGQVTALTRADLDLKFPEKIRPKISSYKPQMIINASAYTAVDKAERYHSLANKINHLAVAELAKLSTDLYIPLIHYSTDYVFGGNTNVPHTIDDKTNPQSVYGKTKLAGEEAIRKYSVLYTILRTSWLYSNIAPNFVLTMRKLFERGGGECIKVVADQIGSPTWARTVAEETVRYIQLSGKPGLQHLSCSGSCSWYEFAKEIASYIPTDIKILPITSAEYKTAAPRPKYSVLKNSINGVLHWKEALHQYFKRDQQ